MPALTTARTTAFMPALSPPEVRTAIFIVSVFRSPQDRTSLGYILSEMGVAVGNDGGMAG